MDDTRTVVYDDGTRVATVWHTDGSPPTVTTTPPAGSDEANRQAVVAKLPVALAANITALAVLAGTPTGAQVARPSPGTDVAGQRPDPVAAW